MVINPLIGIYNDICDMYYIYNMILTMILDMILNTLLTYIAIPFGFPILGTDDQ